MAEWLESSSSFKALTRKQKESFFMFKIVKAKLGRKGWGQTSLSSGNELKVGIIHVKATLKWREEHSDFKYKKSIFRTADKYKPSFSYKLHSNRIEIISH